MTMLERVDTPNGFKLIGAIFGVKAERTRQLALQIPALTVAKLYKKRWEIELFFKWIKGNLEIKHYYGASANAVKTKSG
jgi:IS4 transposase